MVFTTVVATGDTGHVLMALMAPVATSTMEEVSEATGGAIPVKPCVMLMGGAGRDAPQVVVMEGAGQDVVRASAARDTAVSKAATA